MTLLAHEAGVARVIADDPWITLGPDETLDETLDEASDVIVPLEGLDRVRPVARGRVGLRVPGDADADAVAARLGGVDLVQIELPRFTDGRAYTLARLLREKHGFRGELRASGAVLPDQLHYLARCGFDSFELADGGSVEDALAVFSDLSQSYQPAADGARPAWRRRRPVS